MPIQLLENLSVIKISGADAAGFLQGQLTNDIDLLENSWQLTGFCNPKGRLLALLQLWRNQDEFYAMLASDLTEFVRQRLGMYVLRSKVVIEACEELSVIACETTDDARLACPAMTGLIDQVTADSGSHPQYASAEDHSHLLMTQQGVLLITNESVTGVSSSAFWATRMIDAGIPQVVQATSELFIPQMLNLDKLQGISFSKGCYTGQEIVARMHYLGKLKQRMFVCKLEAGGARPAPADKIFTAPAANSPSGTVVSVNDNGDRVLAVLRLADLDSAHYLEEGRMLTIEEDQPYPVNE